MCTLAIYFQASDDFPVVVAANRDEFYERPATPPVQLAGDPWIVAGQDLVAGGTWLGVNAHRVVAGIVNRRSSTAPDPTRRSRGQLCMEALRAASVTEARTALERDPGTLYNPFNLLIAAPDTASVTGNVSGTMSSTLLTPGLHLLTNLELNDFECPRIAKSYALFDAVRQHLRADSIAALLAALHSILSDHSTPLDPRSDGPPNNLCVHTERFGTRSSSILVYAARAGRFRFWHANGPPCQVEYTEVSLPNAA
ncbi:MAG TPA: NRDE family protein [Candidatus Margulisiibacteriota bacterium]|nr:NRDE family protein [Candidatus Margulisiibacteriota bacterium]